jgi:hypothetical protein
LFILLTIGASRVAGPAASGVSTTGASASAARSMAAGRGRRRRCVSCSCVFTYVITREVAGGGHSAFYLNNAGAAASAKMRAHANLNRALHQAIEPVQAYFSRKWYGCCVSGTESGANQTGMHMSGSPLQ